MSWEGGRRRELSLERREREKKEHRASVAFFCREGMRERQERESERKAARAKILKKRARKGDEETRKQPRNTSIRLSSISDAVLGEREREQERGKRRKRHRRSVRRWRGREQETRREGRKFFLFDDDEEKKPALLKKERENRSPRDRTQLASTSLTPLIANPSRARDQVMHIVIFCGRRSHSGVSTPGQREPKRLVVACLSGETGENERLRWQVAPPHQKGEIEKRNAALNSLLHPRRKKISMLSASR